MTCLVILEHNQKQLLPAAFTTLTGAQEIGGDIDVLVAGASVELIAKEAAMLPGIRKVLTAEHESFEHFLAEPTSALIANLASNYTHICAPATTFGKNILPRLGALLDMQPITDVTKIISGTTFERPIYAGNAIATVESSDRIKLLTLRPTAFAASKPGTTAAPTEAIAFTPASVPSRFVSFSGSNSDKPDLASAACVISGGRGLQNKENFAIVDELADILNAAVGASRAAVDAGFVPNDYQVGQTGKVVAPDLYIAIGISGAIQHLAGMKDSKVIVAINKDENAPIFNIADYGLVADLFKAVPELCDQLRALKGVPNKEAV